MSPERRGQAALATLLTVVFGGATLITLSAPLLAEHRGLAVALFAALPIVAVGCAIEVLESPDD